MFITVGDNQYELSTKLGTSKRIEDKFKIPLIQLMSKLENALSTELIDIIVIAADKVNDKDFMKDIYDNWDYSDLYGTVIELVVRLQYTGTTEQIEAKLNKVPMDEEQKNLIRRLLGMQEKVVQLPEMMKDLTGAN